MGLNDDDMNTSSEGGEGLADRGATAGATDGAAVGTAIRGTCGRATVRESLATFG